MNRFFIALVLSIFASSIEAGTISFTGAELFSNPNISFPTTSPTLNGSSIVFGSGGSSHGKLLVLPLLPSGTGDSSVLVSLNLTRLACSGSCNGDSGDHDPLVALGDGSILIGAQFADDGSVFADVLTDQGSAGNRTDHDSFAPFSMPAIGQAFDVEVSFVLTTTTTLNANSNSFVVPASALDTSEAIAFAFMRNNDSGEQYQINTLSISSPELVPAPAALWLFGSALGLLGWMRRSTS